MDREVYLVGLGPGGAALFTREAEEAIAKSQCVFGASRVLEAAEPLIGGKIRCARFEAAEILRFIEGSECRVFSVLLSGDPGFYSGARKLIPLIEERGWKFRVVNGVSSLAYFAGRLGIPWEDFEVVSLHGRRGNVAAAVSVNPRTLFLTGADQGAAEICAALQEARRAGALPGELRVSVGERLSYPDERIRRGSPEELAALRFDPLSVVLVENRSPFSPFRGNYSLEDDAFIRGRVPMTKEEVRTVSLSKLRLEPESVAWDIGAGTGSVSCEMALRAFRGRVYAVERSREGVSLIEQNRDKLGIRNLEVCFGTAPEALEALPPPDRVFIGGSSGHLEGIILHALGRNPQVRLVINAVTLETLSQALSLMKKYALAKPEFVQIGAARGTQAGNSTLMKALDPVYIISGGTGGPAERRSPLCTGPVGDAAPAPVVLDPIGSVPEGEAPPGPPLPRLCIAAGSSGGGKTTLSCGLLQALLNRGLSPAAFKAGPDYIDPMFHREVIGAPSSNLDLFLLDEDTVLRLLKENSRGKDIALLEGVMGFYDGLGGAAAEASTWQLARVTGTPVLLVEDCRGSSLSAAARIKGLAEFRENSGVRAVILNRLGGALYDELKAVIEGETGLAVCGYLPLLKECALESRHLGLVTAAEIGDLRKKIETLSARIEETVDLDRLIALARAAPPLPGRPRPEGAQTPRSGSPGGIRIAVARDRAFCFYYEDGLRLLEELGAELVPFSPLKDRSLPSGIRGLYLGGGYPELHAPELSENLSLRSDIRAALEGGLPCIAECGGFMYLHRTLTDEGGRPHPMVGFIPGSCTRQSRLVRFGYAYYRAREDNLLCRRGETLRGHEFHYWDSDYGGDGFVGMKGPKALSSSPASEWPCIVAGENLYAGFPHLHFCSDPRMAERFLDRCGRL